MDTAWQSSIDRTLRNTEATLQNLQQRRRSYERAKHRVDDYLGASSPPRDHTSLDSLERADIGVPPPLPQHRRYQPTAQDRSSQAFSYSHNMSASGAAPPAAAAASSSWSFNLKPQPPAQQPGTTARRAAGVSDGGTGGPPGRDDPTAPLQLVNAQVRGAMLELELEKAKRADSIRELSYRTAAELAELRSMIAQLRDENTALRKSVRVLEGRLGYGPDARSTTSLLVGDSQRNGTFAALSTSEMPPHAQPSHMGTQDSATAAAALMARVEALESGLARQQQLAEDRQSRTASLLREMVKAEVGTDMEGLRTTAREAARAGTEELLKLRLSSVESSVQTEVQRALRACATSEAAAQRAQQQCGEVEHRLSTQLQKLSAQFVEWQRGAATTSSQQAAGALSLATAAGGRDVFASQAAQERVLSLERVTEESMHEVRGQLRQLRQDTEAQLERLQQQHKQLQSHVQGKADTEEVRRTADRVDEQLRSGGLVTRDAVVALVRGQLQPLQESLAAAREAAQTQQDGVEAWKRQAGLRFAALEAAAKECRDEAERQEQQLTACAHEARQARAEVVAAQGRASDVARQGKSEVLALVEEKLAALEARLQSAAKDRQQQWDGQLRQLQSTAVEQVDAAQRSKFAAEAAEERLRRVETSVATMESSVPQGLAEVRARCEAVQAVLQQTCALPLTKLQQEVEAVQRRVVAADEERARATATAAQQLADAKQFCDEHVRNSRDMLEQRIAHHRELYEELRSQQAVQRRNAEEQLQLVVEQVTRLQQQQQQQQAQMYAMTPPKTVTARGVPEGGHQDGSGGGSAASAPTPAVQALEQRVDGVVAQVQELQQSQKTSAERAAAATASAIADAVSSLQRRLRDVEESQTHASKEQQLRVAEVERALSEQLKAVTESSDAAAKAVAAQLSRLQEETAAKATPPQLVAAIVSDPECCQRLADQLRDRVGCPSSTVQTLAELQSTSAQHTQELHELRAGLRESQQQREAAAAAAAAAEAAATRTADSNLAPAKASAEMHESTQAALRELREQCAALQQQQSALEDFARRQSEERVGPLAEEMRAVKAATTPLEQSVQQIAEQCSALQAAQRQQLPSLQKYVQDVLDVTAENQAALIDPLQLKLRAVDERSRRAQVELETWMEEHDTAAQQSAASQQKRMEQLRADLEAQTAAQLQAVGERVEAAHASVTSLAERVLNVEETMQRSEEKQQDLEDRVATLAGSVQSVAALASTAAAERSRGEPSPSLSPSSVQAQQYSSEKRRGSLEGAAPAAARTVAMVPEEAADMQAYVEELESRLTQLEEHTNDSLAATADALAAFGAQLQDVVARFAVAVNAADAEADDVAPAAAVMASAASIRSLEDVFLFFLQQLQQLQRALVKLQANTVETLEILEQHEESTAALPVLQHTVDAIAAALVPLADRLGVDATSFNLFPDTPSHRHHRHHLDVYPPSFDSSESSMHGTEREVGNNEGAA